MATVGSSGVRWNQFVDALTHIEVDRDTARETSDVIRRAQAELERAVVEGGLTKDPLRLPLGAMAVTLGAMEKLFSATAARFQLTSEDLDRRLVAAFQQASQPVDPKTMEQLRTAAARGASQEVLSLVRTHSLRMSLLAVAAFAGSVLIASIGGFWWGRWSAETNFHETEQTLAQAFREGPDAAAAWANLMMENDLPAALATCTGARVRLQEGRRVCAVPLWLDPQKARRQPTAR
jgi:hypothetical protein